MQILALGEKLLDGRAMLRDIAAFFCKAIYRLIAWLYELFLTIARVNILSSEEIDPIYQRVAMILTIVMVFYISFEFVKYVVQPDTISDKEKGAGNIGFKMILVILMIAFVPKIFTLAYRLQGRLLETQFFSKVILGKDQINNEINTYGREFSANVFSLFYKVDEEVCKGCDSVNVVNFNLNRLATTGDLKYLTNGLTEYEKVYNPATGKNEDTPTIDFDGIYAIVVGCFIAYILVLYCVDVGTRYAQLIFLQIISPVAIIGYLTPKKDNMFNKWLKQCITTYLNLFIRIIIIYFILLICKVIGEAYGNGKLFEGLGEISPDIKVATYIALIMGLLIFANKAPKMLGELLPSGGAAGIGFGIGAKDRFEPTIKAAKGVAQTTGKTLGYTRKALGGTAGFVAGAIKGKSLRGALKGAKAGASKDLKGLRQGSIYNRVRSAAAAGEREYQDDEEILNNAPVGTSKRRAINQSRNNQQHWKNVSMEQDRQLAVYDAPKKAMDSVGAKVDEFKQIKAIKQELESAKSRGADAATIKTIDAKYKAACTAVRDLVVKNNGVVTYDASTGQFKDKNGDEITLEYTYRAKDANGFDTGTVIRDTYNFDSGDTQFTSSLNTIAQGEWEKARNSDVLKNIEVEIKDDSGATVTKKICDMSASEYIKNINKVKDAMDAPKTSFENSREFQEAHAFSKGSGGSN